MIEETFKSADRTGSKTEHWTSPAGHEHLINFCLKAEQNLVKILKHDKFVIFFCFSFQDFYWQHKLFCCDILGEIKCSNVHKM